MAARVMGKAPGLAGYWPGGWATVPLLQQPLKLREVVPFGWLQIIGFCHMRIGDGVNSRLQLSGLLADLCKVSLKSMG